MTVSVLSPPIPAVPQTRRDLAPAPTASEPAISTPVASTPAVNEPARTTTSLPAVSPRHVYRRSAELTAIVLELAELAADRSIAYRMPAVTEWMAEITEQRTMLLRRARALCIQLGEHQLHGCRTCSETS